MSPSADWTGDTFLSEGISGSPSEDFLPRPSLGGGSAAGTGRKSLGVCVEAHHAEPCACLGHSSWKHGLTCIYCYYPRFQTRKPGFRGTPALSQGRKSRRRRHKVRSFARREARATGHPALRDPVPTPPGPRASPGPVVASAGDLLSSQPVTSFVSVPSAGPASEGPWRVPRIRVTAGRSDWPRATLHTGWLLASTRFCFSLLELTLRTGSGSTLYFSQVEDAG